MLVDDYQKEAVSTAVYGEGNKIIYPTLGLCGEAGEVAEKIKKVLRDKAGVFDDERKQEIAKELGDVMWYIANIANDLGFNLETICQMNLEKLFSRRDRNKIHGEGDNR